MTKLKLMNESEYGRHRGVRKQTVATWKKRGFLVWQDGLIHPQASDAILNSRPQTYRGGQAIKRVGPEAGPIPEQDFSDLATVPLSEAVRRKECALAATREIALERLRGNIVLVTDIEPGWARTMQNVRSAVLSIPGRARMLLQLDAAQTEGLRKIVHEALTAAATGTAPPIDGQSIGAAE